MNKTMKMVVLAAAALALRAAALAFGPVCALAALTLGLVLVGLAQLAPAQAFALPVAVFAMLQLGILSGSAAESSFKFSKAFSGIQAQILAHLFNTSTGHSHDGTDSRQLGSSALASSSVTTAKIAAGAVDTTKLGSDAVTTVKILDAAVTTPKIADGAVDTSKLGSGSVTANKLAAVFMDVKTKAQFSASTPAVGQVALCSDCTIPYSVCVGTGAVLSGWKVSHSATVGCGVNN